MAADELNRATELNRQLEGRWVSLFTYLAKQGGESTATLVLELGDDGLKARNALNQARSEYPTAEFNELHFLPFPQFFRLAELRRAALERLGNPPSDWLDRMRSIREPLTRYRNHLSHVDRFAFLPESRQRDAIQRYEQSVRWLDEWFPNIPQLNPRPMPEQQGARAALAALDRDEQSARALVRELGFDVIKSPTNLVAEGSNNDLRETLGDLVPRLYRAGAKKVGNGEVALFIAYIDRWPERSAERESYRRRIATAVTRYRDKLLAQRALVVMIDDGMDREEAERLRGIYEAEFIYPTESANGKGVRTVRATVDLTDPTRYHVDLIESLSIAGLTSVSAIRKRWNDAFSVDAVTRTFFAELRELRDRIARAFVSANPDHPILGSVNLADFDTGWNNASPAQREIQTQLRALATRQLCRMLFLWFLQQKGWLGSTSVRWSRAFLIHLYNLRSKGRADTYFSDILVPLFFDGIGSPASTEAHQALQTKLLEMMSKVFKDAEIGIPYLNGGLFRLDADPFEAAVFGVGEDGRRTLEVVLPDSLFEEHEASILLGTAKSSTRPHPRTVLGLLSRYRFTTQESTPDDQSVDPDPELLGKVFEDLYQSDERHDTGAYYTPREVVRYMCRRALDGYLRETTKLTQETLDQLRQEAADWEASPLRLTTREERVLQTALDNVTIVDPAVGSGAFLVGMLQEIVLMRRGITAAQTDVEIASSSRAVYDWKRHAITQSLYGVDINPTAVEICRLRLWLSLVIDFEPTDVVSIPALPNLEFRIVAGDSLIDRMGKDPFPDSLPRGTAQADFETERRYRELATLQDSFDDAEERGDSRRIRMIAGQIREVRREIALAQMNWAIEGAEGRREKLRRDYSASSRGRKSTALEAAEREVASLLTLRDGLRAEAPFQKPLLWPLAFPQVFERGGFDIVVANPPYVEHESLSATDQQIYSVSFSDVYSGKADLFVYFFARAIQVLRDGGWLAFITSNRYMRAQYGANLREFLPTWVRVDALIDFGDLPVFNVAAYPAIVVGQKILDGAEPDASHQLLAADLGGPIRHTLLEEGTPVNSYSVRGALADMPSLVVRTSQAGFSQSLLRRDGWVLEDQVLLNLFERLLHVGTPLGEYTEGRIFNGIKTGINDAFVIDEVAKNRLVDKDSSSAEIIRPWLRGRDIKRWETEWAGLYVIALQNSGDRDARNPWSSAATEAEARDIFAAVYPAVHAHLSQWESRLSSRADQGRYWWELRPCVYYTEMQKPKIVWPENSPPHSASFAIDEKGYFANNKAFFITGAPEGLCVYLNSPLSLWLFDKIATKLRGGWMEMRAAVVGRVPVPHGVNTLSARWENDFDLHQEVCHLLGLSQDETSRLWTWFEDRQVTITGNWSTTSPASDRVNE